VRAETGRGDIGSKIGLHEETSAMFSPLKHQPRRTTSARTPRARCRPRLEALEARRLLSAGALDPTFGSGGIVTTSVGSATSWNGAAAVAIYPNAGTANDGDVVAVGNAVTGKHSGFPVDNFAVIRYSPNGTLDPSFGNGGELTTIVSSSGGSRANDVSIQADGKIVAAGYGADASGNLAFTVVRYNVNGSLDTTFGSGKTAGIVQTHMSRGSIDEAETVAIQPDGKIVVAGLTTPQGSSASQFAVVRYNTNGSLDTTFNGSGMVVSHFTGSASGNPRNAVDLAIYPSTSPGDAGKIVEVGLLHNADGTYSVAVLRYNSNGSVDTPFGGTGFVLLNTPSNPISGLDSVSLPHVAIQADDSLDIAFTGDGVGSTEMSVVRLQASGSMDTSFGSGGVVVTQHQMWDTALSIALQTNGAIVVGGTEGAPGSSNETFVVARFNPTDGSLDTTFGVNGFQTAPVQIQNSYGVDIAIQPDCKIVTAGTQDVNTSSGYIDFGFALARFLPSESQIGSFTASPDPVTAGSDLTLTASNITDANPGATITQVAFYVDLNGTDTLLGYGTQNSQGVWTLTFTVELAPGTYTLVAQAEDSDGVVGAPSTLSLTVD
jgi:uncharacterized delta-60 repeat protein